MAWSIPDDLPSVSERWATPDFRTELEAWVAGEVGAVRQSEQVRLRPWSTVWRVDTTAGVFYAKQNCPLQGFEAALVAELQTIAPDRVVPAAAVDLDRGFLLTPDQGPVLWREGAPSSPGTWESLVVEASRLQREVSPQADRLVTRVGLTALPPERSGEQAADRIEALAALPAGDPRRRRCSPTDTDPRLKWRTRWDGTPGRSDLRRHARLGRVRRPPRPRAHPRSPVPRLGHGSSATASATSPSPPASAPTSVSTPATSSAFNGRSRGHRS